MATIQDLKEGDPGVRTIRPTLFIALGGTGIKILSRIKRNIRRDYPPVVPFGYVAIDCDTIQREKYGLTDSETAEVGNFDGDGVVKNLHDHPSIERWWPSEVPPGYIGWGAAQIRPAGRLSFYHRYLERIEPVFECALNNLFRILTPQQEGELRRAKVSVMQEHLSVYILASLCGGTGAGMYFDTALAARWFITERRPGVRTTVTGVFTLPTGYLPKMSLESQKSQLRCNTYAALKEIDRFSDPENASKLTLRFHQKREEFHPSAGLFDGVYLLDMQNTRSRGLQELNQIYDMIATRLSLEIAFEAMRLSVEENRKLLLRKRVRGKSRLYGSFAAAALRFPLEKIRRFCVLRYACEVLDDLKAMGAEQKSAAVSDQIGRFMRAQHLEERGTGQLVGRLRVDSNGNPYPGGEIPAGPTRPDEIDREVQDRTGVLGKRLAEAHKEMRENASEIVGKAKEALDAEVTQILSKGSQTGLDYALLFLNQLKANLADVSREIEAKARRYTPSAWQVRVKETVQSVVSAKGKWLGSQKASAREFLRWSQHAREWAQHSVELHARRLAVEIYASLTQAAHDWVRKINRSFTAVGEIQARLNEWARTECRTVEQERREQFFLVEEIALDDKQLDEFYRRNKPKSSEPFLRAIFEGAEALEKYDAASPDEIIRERILPALEKSFSSLEGLDLASVLREYAGGRDANQYILDLARNCAPFLQYSRSAFGEADDRPSELLYVGLDDSRNEKYAKLKEALASDKSWNSIQYISTGDPSQILLVASLECLPVFPIQQVHQYAHDYKITFQRIAKEIEDGQPPCDWVHLSKEWPTATSLPDLMETKG